MKTKKNINKFVGFLIALGLDEEVQRIEQARLTEQE